ncbi:hypothetical protein OS122_19250, partial [Mycolicibacterium mucogenicum]|uniref:hypothetical protein n=1 Tax=Mycolicibacterium mucogenicum TaxID=56689 RepID=UPI00226AAD10
MITMKRIGPWLTAAALGSAIVLAPIASADTGPLTPHSTDPYAPYVLGQQAHQTTDGLNTPF